MTRRLAPLLILLITAPSWAAAPKAAIATRPAIPSGSTAYVDASGSVSDLPVSILVAGRPNEPVLYVEGRKGAIFPALPDGTYTAVAVCLGKVDDASPLASDVAAVTFAVGGPRPPPEPPPNPDPDAAKPLPAPASPIQALGRRYGADQLRAYADSWAESRTMLAAGVPVKQVSDGLGKRWLDRRNPYFVPAQQAFAAIAPEGVEPAGAARDALAKAWQDFETGLREAIR